MHIPKKYGQSKKETCPFCNNGAVFVNKQGLSVCRKHKGTALEDIKCLCGSYLEIRKGKYGSYFFCINCGNISLKKGLMIREANKKACIQNNKENKSTQEKYPVHKINKKDDFILDSGKYNDFDYGIQ